MMVTVQIVIKGTANWTRKILLYDSINTLMPTVKIKIKPVPYYQNSKWYTDETIRTNGVGSIFWKSLREHFG